MKFLNFTVIILLLGSTAHPLVSAEPPISGFPSFEVSVQQDSGVVYFEFYDRAKPGSSEKKLPHNAAIISVHFAGKDAFWQVSGHNLDTGATDHVWTSKAAYGVVPEGFVQVIPKQGTAPVLETGVQYYVTARGGGIGHTSFIYTGGR